MIIARQILDFALLQSVAECYLDRIDDPNSGIRNILREGANNAALQGKSPTEAILTSATRWQAVI